MHSHKYLISTVIFLLLFFVCFFLKNIYLVFELRVYQHIVNTGVV